MMKTTKPAAPEATRNADAIPTAEATARAEVARFHETAAAVETTRLAAAAIGIAWGLWYQYRDNRSADTLRICCTLLAKLEAEQVHATTTDRAAIACDERDVAAGDDLARACCDVDSIRADVAAMDATEARLQEEIRAVQAQRAERVTAAKRAVEELSTRRAAAGEPPPASRRLLQTWRGDLAGLQGEPATPRHVSEIRQLEHARTRIAASLEERRIAAEEERKKEEIQQAHEAKLRGAAAARAVEARQAEAAAKQADAAEEARLAASYFQRIEGQQ
jgi:hypothetical protein